MAKIKLTETGLCSAPNALRIFNMPLEDIKPCLKAIDQAGYYSCEIMDRNLYLNAINIFREDPWERIQAIAAQLENTRLQVSFAGSYLWGDQPFEKSIIDFFVSRLSANKVEIVRIFDPLNDINNLEYPIKVARDQNLHVQAAIMYTASDFHSSAFYSTYAKNLVKLGVDSICICDPCELLGPYTTYNLVAQLRTEVKIPIQFSTTNSTGVGYMNTLKAIEASADIVDTAISPFAEGASYPATETIINTFSNTPYDSGMDLEKVNKVESAFAVLQNKYLQDGQLSAKKMIINTIALNTNLPDDMIDYINNIMSSPKPEMLEKLIKEIFRLREMSGSSPYTFPIYIGLVDQALINITTGNEFSVISPEFLNLLKGTYGTTPSSIDPSFKDEIINKSSLPKKAKSTLEELKLRLPEKFNEQSEDVLTLAQFPLEAPEYFELRSNTLYGVDGKNSDKKSKVHPV